MEHRFKAENRCQAIWRDVIRYKDDRMLYLGSYRGEIKSSEGFSMLKMRQSEVPEALST